MKNVIIEGIPEIGRIGEWNDLSEELGIAFEYNDFFMPCCINDEDEYARRLSVYKGLNRKSDRDTLHGAFLDIAVNSGDGEIMRLSAKRCEKSVETALELNCRGVVFHTNYIIGFKSDFYRSEWVKRCAGYYRTLAEKYPEINIFVENMFDDTPELLRRLAEEMEGVKNFGVCFDVAHAALWNLPLGEWTDSLKKYTRHVHINDNDLCQDLHLPMGDGKIDYGFLKEKPFTGLESMLLEVNGIEGFKKSYEYLKTRLV